jgi:hypothetical protein
MDAGTTLSEQYLSAGNSKDLTVRQHGRRDDIEALVAVAWSRSKLGALLLQLMGEWDSAAKQGMRFEQSFLKLKAMPEVRGAMVFWTLDGKALPPTQEQWDAANDLSWSILTWWLDRACKACKGTGWVTRPNSPKKPCTTCHGTREAVIPHGQTGRALVAHLESCMYRHRASGRAKR